jgi:hypothetical protein
MVSDEDRTAPPDASRQRIDIHVHRDRDPGYREYGYVDEPLPGEVAAAAGLSILHAVLVVLLLILIALLIASLLGAVSVSEIADGLRDLRGGTDTPAQPAQ